jgi:hypothetical protein
MPLLTDHTRLHPGPDLLTSTLTADEIVILHMGQGTYFSLDHVGAALWHHLATAPCTFAELADFVEAHYAVSPGVCRNDLAAFLEALLTHDLLRLQDP